MVEFVVFYLRCRVAARDADISQQGHEECRKDGKVTGVVDEETHSQDEVELHQEQNNP